jgi:hypothetical protein
MAFGGVRGKRRDKDEARPEKGRHDASRPNTSRRICRHVRPRYISGERARPPSRKTPKVQTANKIRETKFPAVFGTA